MGFDSLLMPLIGVAGLIVGAIAAILFSHIKATSKRGSSYVSHGGESLPIHGEDVDIRELRVLRALFGEPEGRRLENFKDRYYRPFLEATIDKGWVKRAGRRYVLTPNGGEFCRKYLSQLLVDWRPGE